MATQPDDNRRTPLVGSLRLPRTPRAGAKGNVSADERVPMIIELDVRYPGGLEAVRNDFYQCGTHTRRSPPPTRTAPRRARSSRRCRGGSRSSRRSSTSACSRGPRPRSSSRTTGAASATAARRRPPSSGSGPTTRSTRRSTGRRRPSRPTPPGARMRRGSWRRLGRHRQRDRRGAPPLRRARARRRGRRHPAAAPLHGGAAPRLHRPRRPREPAGSPAGAARPGARHRPGRRQRPRHPCRRHHRRLQSRPARPAGRELAGAAGRRLRAAAARRRSPGMAPDCELISLKVMRRSPAGQWVTSSAAVIRALTYLRMEVNVDPGVLRVHGVNMSLGSRVGPGPLRRGQSPLCQAVNQLVDRASSSSSPPATTAPAPRATPRRRPRCSGRSPSPAHAQECIAVGSTHRDAPHAFGVTWTPRARARPSTGARSPTSSRRESGSASAATGQVARRRRLHRRPGPTPQPLTYAELSGTSMAAPHVSGVSRRSCRRRPEFIGRPAEVKALLTASATDLGPGAVRAGGRAGRR